MSNVITRQKGTERGIEKGNEERNGQGNGNGYRWIRDGCKKEGDGGGIGDGGLVMVVMMMAQLQLQLQLVSVRGRKEQGLVLDVIERDRTGEARIVRRIIERGTHYPVIRSAASGIIGNSLLCLVGAVFNVHLKSTEISRECVEVVQKKTERQSDGKTVRQRERERERKDY